MTGQQTVLRVRTNRPGPTITGTTSISVTGSTTGFTYSGTGTVSDPYMGNFPSSVSSLQVNVVGSGTLHFEINLTNVAINGNFLSVFIKHAGDTSFKRVFTTYSDTTIDKFEVISGDIIYFQQNFGTIIPSTYEIYVVPSEQTTDNSIIEYDNLDLYEDIPIKINKSFSEIQDIGKRNSDYSVGLKLPGSKKNNRFFENFYDVDNVSLYFDVTKKVQCNVLINDQSFFEGYLRLNSISVENSKVEYDVTIYSNVADLFGAIGNNLLKDLNFRDADYFFNHTFERDNCLKDWLYETLKSNEVVPSNYFYPISHNGYNYTQSGNRTVVQTGTTEGTSIYTTTKLGSWANLSSAYSAGVERGHINSPEDGIRDNQLKPALNVYSLIHLIFKSYGYKIKSDFFTTPWFKLLYMYGYVSDNSPKLSFQAPPIQTYGLSGVQLVYTQDTTTSVTMYVVKAFTSTPALCDTPITGTLYIRNLIGGFLVSTNFTIPANTSSYTINWTAGNSFNNITSIVGAARNTPLNYLPSQTGTTVNISDGDYLDFSLVIDQNIKQIDFLSSIAKKFNLVFIPSKDNPFEIIVEPYQYYIGTGNIYDWTDKLSYDKGFTVQPAQNFVESELHLTDKIDGDAGNTEFEKANNRIYGRNIVYNPTEFKSTEKKIETIFSPQILRKWNPTTLTGVTNDVGIPLMINYTESSQDNNNAVDWTYSGVKTNPRLIYNVGNFSPFLDQPLETFTLTGITTSKFRITQSDGWTGSSIGSLISPVVTHTMPIGNPDDNKINNDSISILFNGETSTNIAGKSVELIGSGSTLNIYTDQNVYELFYYDRVQNAFDKNTRMLSGFFDLSIRDINKLHPKDLIKVKDQYFTWNKIDNYNLTSRELTKVELIQSNYEVSTYPERYFNYQYCSGNTTTYKFKTNFTGTTSVYESFYYYSIFYDYMVGALGGSASGFTSSIPYTGTTYIPFSIWEVDENTYLNSGTSYTGDPLSSFFLLNVENNAPQFPSTQRSQIWLISSNGSQGTLNVFTGCTQFNSKAATLGVSVSSAPSSFVFQSGATIDVTTAGYLTYETPTGTTLDYVSIGTNIIIDCAKCNTIIPFPGTGFPASFTITSCGTNC